MNRVLRFKAIFLLVLILTDIVMPLTALALTGGPSQPEVQSFEPVGTSDMVDLFTGDFNYNIPLLDVNGYPINIAYHAGVSQDQEASWVGLGWNINPGNINRNLRGLPDDMDGDPIKYEKNQKTNIIFRAGTGFTPELFGRSFSDLTKNQGVMAGNFGLIFNNYKGISSELGLGIGAKDGSKLAENLKAFNKSSLDLTFSSDGGMTIMPNLAFDNGIGAFKVGSSFNTSEGIRSLNFSGLKKGSEEKNTKSIRLGGSFSFNKPQYTPGIKHGYRSMSLEYELKTGSEIKGFYPNLDLSASIYTQTLRSKTQNNTGQGYLYEKPRTHENQVFDYNRENDGPVSEISPFLPWTNHTYDIYQMSAQGTGGTYRLFRNDVPVFNDQKIVSSSNTISLGTDIGALDLLKAGINKKVNYAHRESSGWRQKNGNLLSDKFGHKLESHIRNNYLLPAYEQTYFKDVNELIGTTDYKQILLSGVKGLKTSITSPYLPQYLGSNLEEVKAHLLNKGDQNAKINLSTVPIDFSSLFNLKENFYDFNNQVAITTELGDFFINERTPRNSLLMHHTAEEEDLCLNKEIINTKINTKTYKNGRFDAHLEPRIININIHAFNGVYHSNDKHITQMVQIQPDGSKYVFDIPAYNHVQIDKQFRVHADQDNIEHEKGEVVYGTGVNTKENTRGIDHHYEGTFTPAYVHSYLLTGVLSPDYVDLTGNGITEDDLGSAVKFNYSKALRVYNWRVPFGTNSAKYAEGLKSDTEDDIGSYTYGQKEVWYLHSIEGKTHVALFTISKRNDGLGVLSENGGKDTSSKLFKLDKIELFSKRELIEYGSNAVPIKTVHFVYNYELCKGIENQMVEGDGKLTLKEIYFTYGKSKKGKFNGYKFEYNSGDDVSYHINAYDRWGNYSPVRSNPGNAEFPYTSQIKDSADRYASLWNLSKIHLPSGGSISVHYEADDYAYVQDNAAMRMFMVKGVGYKGDGEQLVSGDKLYGSKEKYDYLFFELEENVPDNSESQEYIRNHYFDRNQKYIQSTFYVNINKSNYEYIKTYIEIAYTNGKIDCGITDNGSTGWVRIIPSTVKDKNKGAPLNPIAEAAFQFTRMNLEFLINPASRTINDKLNLYPGIAQVKMVGAFLNDLVSFVTNPNRTLMLRNFCKEFVASKSWIRLRDPDGVKFGGGHRVRRIVMSDSWHEMNTGDDDAIESVYGQEYDYTLVKSVDEDGEVKISSGVASNEPSLGNDENPFVQPYFYDQKRKGVPDIRYTFEYPVLSSYLPAATVGYSQITVKSIQKSGQNKINRTGYSVHEFYTAKDFPVKIEHSYLDKSNKLFFSDRLKFDLFSFGIKNEFAIAQQGFKIITNDMHGKAKGTKNYSENNNLTSGTSYDYSWDNEGELSNKVLTIDEKGKIKESNLGLTIELQTDARRFNEKSATSALRFNMDVVKIPFLPIPVPVPSAFSFMPSITSNHVYTSSTVKVISQKGILHKTTAFKEGSKITTENLLYDAQTAEVLLTSTENEFGDKIYNFKYPAHWAYDEGMGLAFKNWGLEISGLKFNNGEVSCSNTNLWIKNFLVPGDKCMYRSKYEDKIVWVYRALNDSLVLIDRYGGLINKGLAVTEHESTLRVIESGRKNMASSEIGSITCRYNPLHDAGGGNYSLQFSQVLATSATEYSDNWKTDFDLIPEYYCDTILTEAFYTTVGLMNASVQDSSLKNSYKVVFGKLSCLSSGVFRAIYDLSSPGPYPEHFVGSKTMEDRFIDSFHLNDPETYGYELLKMAKLDHRWNFYYNFTLDTSIAPLSKFCMLINDETGDIEYYNYISSHNYGKLCNPVDDSMFVRRLDATSNCEYAHIDLNFYRRSGSGFIIAPNDNSTLMYRIFLDLSDTLFLFDSISAQYFPVSDEQIWNYNSEFSTYPTIERGYSHHKVFLSSGLIDSVANMLNHSDPLLANLRWDGEWKDHAIGGNIYGGNLDATCPISLEGKNLKLMKNILSVSDPIAVNDTTIRFTAIIKTHYNETDTVPLFLRSGCLKFKDCELRCKSIKKSSIVNPYLTGNKGNWRPERSWTYVEDRSYNANTADPRRDGTFKTFSPFWVHNGIDRYTPEPNSDKWVWTNTITEYSPFGMELENMDPLGRYSAVTYGFAQSLPVAVASNTRYSQLWYEGFEEYRYQHTLEDRYICPPWRYAYTVESPLLQDSSGFGNLDKNFSHTGNVSLKINSSLEMVQEIELESNWINDLIDPDTIREFITNQTHQIKAFGPSPGKYIISAWTHENSAANDTLYENNFIIIEFEDGSTIISRDTVKASGIIIEGWQRMESKITVPVGSVLMRMRYVTAAENGWFDDVRFFPYNGSMKSYAYDERTLRLMAELDENNFATFYEYDLEGNLIRVKKETTEGVKSLQENRQHLKPNTP